MKKKAIIFDLDGTAIDSPEKKIPTDELVEAITKLRDKYYLCSASGRVWTFAKPVLKALQLTDPCIISAGTQICNPQTGEILWQKTISQNSLRTVIKILCEYPDYKILYNDNDEHEYFFGGISPRDFNSTEPIYFLELVFVPDELAIQIHDRLSAISDVTCVMVPAQKPETRDLRIINEHATKEHAVAELLKLINVDKKDAIGIGDGHKDIHLFNAVDHKVAMDNAGPELKNLADEVIRSVKDDGLASYFATL